MQMDKTKMQSKLPGRLFMAGGIIGAAFWLAMLFFALFLGGSPGPGHARTVPLLYIPIIALGFIGALLSIAAAVKANRGRSLAVLSILFGAAGCIPFFLLQLTLMGLIVFAVAAAFPTFGLLFTRRLS